MLSVTFSQPIVIDAANLHSLLSLANTPAVVAPYVDAAVAEVPVKRTRKAAAPTDGDKPKRTRATKAEMEARRAAASGAAPAEEPKDEETEPPESMAVVEDTAKASATASTEKPKRDRRSAAQKAKDAEKSKPSGEGKSSDAAPTDPAKLLERFAVLIDSDFDKASALLTEFGVKRFSELPEAQHAAFEGKLKAAGV